MMMTLQVRVSLSEGVILVPSLTHYNSHHGRLTQTLLIPWYLRMSPFDVFWTTSPGRSTFLPMVKFSRKSQLPWKHNLKYRSNVKMWITMYSFFLPFFRFLDVNTPFIMGSLPVQDGDSRIINNDFEGCIKDVYINNRLYSSDDSIRNKETEPGCPWYKQRYLRHAFHYEN